MIEPTHAGSWSVEWSVGQARWTSPLKSLGCLVEFHGSPFKWPVLAWFQMKCNFKKLYIRAAGT